LLRLLGLVDEGDGLGWLRGEFSLRNADGSLERGRSLIGEARAEPSVGIPLALVSVGEGDFVLSTGSFGESSNERIADGEIKGDSFNVSSKDLRSDSELRRFFLWGEGFGGLSVSPMLPSEGPLFCHIESCDMGLSGGWGDGPLLGPSWENGLIGNPTWPSVVFARCIVPLDKLEGWSGSLVLLLRVRHTETL
jgi:hypothetical protein